MRPGHPEVLPKSACPAQARMAYYMALNIVGTTDSLDRADHRRATARNRPDAHARAERIGVQAGGARRAPNHWCAASGVEAEAWTRAAHSGRRGGLEKSVADRRPADPEASPQTRIETLLQMGDWYQIKKLPREALPYYQRAWQVICAEPSRRAPRARRWMFRCAILSDTPDRGHAPTEHAKNCKPTTRRSNSLSPLMGRSRTRASWSGTRTTRRAGDFACSP